jgi:ABC-2 type transport system permease protein
MRGSFRTIFEIVRKEFYQIRQDRRMLFVSIGAPLIQVIVLGYAATLDITDADMVVCDYDRSPVSREFVRTFTSSGHFVAQSAVESEREIDRYFEHGEALAALVLPRGFGDDILRRRPVAVQLLLDGSDANTASVLLGYANQIVNTYNQKVVVQALRSGRGLSAARVLPEPRIWFNPDLKSSYFMVPGVVALVLMIITMMLTSLAIVKEKEIGTLEQLMVTPMRPVELIIGKLIPFTVIGFFDMVIVLSVARFWFNVPLVGNLLLLFCLSGLFILTTLGLGIFISTIARSQQQAMMISQFFFFMPFMFLSGFAIPIANMPPIIQWFTYLIPLRYFLEIVRGIFLKGAGIRELWPQALALFGIGAAILTVSVLRFRKTLG